MSHLEKFLLILSVAFSIVIFSLTLVLLARDYRLAPLPKDCYFSPEDWDQFSPVILERDRLSFVYPDTYYKMITMASNTSLLLACPGTAFRGINGSQHELTCYDGQLQINDQDVQEKDLACLETFNSTARYTGGECFEDAKETEIGYQINATTFVRQIKVCFGVSEKEPVYAEHIVSSSIAARIQNDAKPSLISGIFYTHIDLDKNYDAQQRTINIHLEERDDSTRYINFKNGSYFSRGLLAPNDDFVYPWQQNATYYYINVAPQWKPFRDGNWKVMEEDIRKLAGEKNTDLLVYTGTYGVASLRDNNRTPRELFMVPASINVVVMECPVPKYFWKVVYSAVDKRGIALIGVNNPYIDKESLKEQLICKNVTSRVDWLSWSPNNVDQGLSYACDIYDLRKIVTHIPQLEVEGLLTSAKLENTRDLGPFPTSRRPH